MEIGFGSVGLLIFLFFWAGTGHLIWKVGRLLFVPNSKPPDQFVGPQVSTPKPESDPRRGRLGFGSVRIDSVVLWFV